MLAHTQSSNKCSHHEELFRFPYLPKKNKHPPSLIIPAETASGAVWVVRQTQTQTRLRSTRNG